MMQQGKAHHCNLPSQRPRSQPTITVSHIAFLLIKRPPMLPSFLAGGQLTNGDGLEQADSVRAAEMVDATEGFILAPQGFIVGVGDATNAQEVTYGVPPPFDLTSVPVTLKANP
jgi:hypothetical protein